MKKYIVGLKFNETIYYVRIGADKWDEVYDPRVATRFSTRKEAIDWSNNETTFGKYAVALIASEEIVKYDEFIAGGSIRRTFDFLNKKLSRKYKNESPLEVLKWSIEVASDPDGIRYEDYASWPDLYQVYEHIHSVYAGHSGEMYFTISSKQDATFAKFKKELKLIIPYCGCLEDGYIKFDIFDHFCGDGGNFSYLYYKTDDDCRVSTEYDDLHSGTLKTCFEYIRHKRHCP